MPYYKGVYFEKAFHTEDDVAKHAAENPVEPSEPVAVVAAPAPAAAAPEPVEEPPVSEPGLAVAVDRETPIVEVAPVIDVQSDPFPKFEQEKEPETQPEAAAEPKAEMTVDEMVASIEKTPAETPDAKKKKSGGRSKG
jgi:hypothetical protein